MWSSWHLVCQGRLDNDHELFLFGSPQRNGVLTEHLAWSDNALESRKQIPRGRMTNLLDSLQVGLDIEDRSDSRLVGDRRANADDAQVLEHHTEFTSLDVLRLVHPVDEE